MRYAASALAAFHPNFHLTALQKVRNRTPVDETDELASAAVTPDSVSRKALSSSAVTALSVS